jgi:hypothetical protein
VYLHLITKKGWQISKDSLDDFIQQRLPETYTTNVVKGMEDHNTTIVVKEDIRAEMWREIVNKNIWEGYVKIKKSVVRDCIRHKGYSKELEAIVSQRCVENSQEYRKQRMPYLLEAFRFEGKRLLLNRNFENIEEQVIFAILE